MRSVRTNLCLLSPISVKAITNQISRGTKIRRLAGNDSTRARCVWCTTGRVIDFESIFTETQEVL